MIKMIRHYIISFISITHLFIFIYNCKKKNSRIVSPVYFPLSNVKRRIDDNLASAPRILHDRYIFSSISRNRRLLAHRNGPIQGGIRLYYIELIKFPL